MLLYWVCARDNGVASYYTSAAAATASARFLLRAHYDVRTWVSYTPTRPPATRCPVCDYHRAHV